MHKLISVLLFPLSLLYWCITAIRNLLFDVGVTKQIEFTIPVVSIGNITVGGTGKTPILLYIAQLLHEKKLAVLSRGYKRITSGYAEVNLNNNPNLYGDEPFMIKKKLPNTLVTVCEKRVEGIKTILQSDKNIEVILLDDAFQHRYVKPCLNICLIDFNRPIWCDFVFPSGRMREGKYALKRADIIIITKCYKDITKEQKQIISQKLSLKSNQTLYFSWYNYSDIFHVQSATFNNIFEVCAHKHIILITGIAQASLLYEYVLSIQKNVTHLNFSDHYNYSQNDIQTIKTLCSNKSIILTTEKDIDKLLQLNIQSIESVLYTISISVEIDCAQDFNSQISSKL